MIRMLLGLWLSLSLYGCLDPKAEDVVRDWRPMGQSGPTLGAAVTASPLARSQTWETYAGEAGATTVRLSVEYDAAAAAGTCPTPAKGLQPAARIFLLLDFTVASNRSVTPVSARAQVYTAKGYYEDYPLDLTVMADLMAKVFPLPCTDLVLPDYL